MVPRPETALLVRRALPPQLGQRCTVLPFWEGVYPRLLRAAVWGKFSLRVCSFNVLSLNSLSLEGSAADGLAYQPARPTLLADGLRAAGVHVALLQETRTEEGFLRTQGYLRFASGAASGTLGIEVWLAEDHPLLVPPKGPGRLCLSLASCLVLHRDPRRLFLLLRQDSFRLLIVTLHAPHRAMEVSAIWWAETTRLLDVHAQSAIVLLGGDMGAAVGSIGDRKS